ncbi:DUF4395 domain-containing protein [archaeon]|jgi:hypothetical protein|nr:DUF4395 domain-containing protein [archaeon]
MSKFGEKVEGYGVKVLNEREVRASAGILFFFALIAFLNAWLIGNFEIIKIFVIAFLLDFFIRIFINPKYSPTLIIGRYIVRNQTPEYVGAPQKRFAWIIGFILAITMFILVVLNNVIGPLNLFVCLICLILLFYETSFGICLGCKVYNFFNKEKAKFCPGGSCQTKREKIQKINRLQVLIAILFIVGIIFVSVELSEEEKIDSPENNSSDECEVPQWAIDLGHEEQYVLHHGCG